MAYAVKAGMALMSLRDSNFDSNSAIGEVIDNSIQAGAKNINILLKEGQSRKLDMLVFSDDGFGMDEKTVENCLSLGYSSRYNDRSGIGRFGVGMTLGAIHECLKVEVYSKSSVSDWYYTYLDLEELGRSDTAELPKPIRKKPSNILLSESGISEHGTIVIWSKVDRLDYRNEFINELKFYLGRTFRKFIQGRSSWYEGQLTIKLNGTDVPAWDPLFYYKDRTEFPNDEQSDLFPENILPFEFEDETTGTRQVSMVTINMSLLPFFLRKKQGGGGKSDGMANRKVNLNEGISILRNDREVYFGDPGYGTYYSNSEANTNKTRYVGCEISFTAEIDKYFAVKNIKSGARPNCDLKGLIAQAVKPTFKTQIEKIELDWKSQERLEKQEEEKDGLILPNAEHSESSTLIKKSGVLPKLKDPKFETDFQTFADKLYGGNLPASLNELQEALQTYGIVIVEEEFPGDDFFALGYSNKIRKITFNTGSTFYRSYAQILANVGNSNINSVQDVRVLIDLLLCGFALAIDSIDEDEQFTWETGKRKLKFHWTEVTSQIFKEWQKN